MASSRARDIGRRKKLADMIAEMGPTEHEQILRILHSHGTRYTRNNNGVFCDITKVSDEVLDAVEQFVRFSKDSADMLNEERVDRRQPVDREDAREDKGDADVARPAQAAAAPPAKTERVRSFLTVMTKARAESTANKRKETCRYQQLRKKYSRPVNPKASLANELRPE